MAPFKPFQICIKKKQWPQWVAGLAQTIPKQMHSLGLTESKPIYIKSSLKDMPFTFRSALDSRESKMRAVVVIGQYNECKSNK